MKRKYSRVLLIAINISDSGDDPGTGMDNSALSRELTKWDVKGIGHTNFDGALFKVVGFEKFLNRSFSDKNDS